MPGWFYEASENGHWVFILVTLLIGGAAAWATGKALAETWRPFWQVPVYVVLLACTVRFLHFALFDEVMLSARNFVVDAAILLVVAIASHRLARRRAMAGQYPWLASGQD